MTISKFGSIPASFLALAPLKSCLDDARQHWNRQ
jgi:hypothetical protein